MGLRPISGIMACHHLGLPEIAAQFPAYKISAIADSMCGFSPADPQRLLPGNEFRSFGVLTISIDIRTLTPHLIEIQTPMSLY